MSSCSEAIICLAKALRIGLKKVRNRFCCQLKVHILYSAPILKLLFILLKAKIKLFHTFQQSFLFFCYESIIYIHVGNIKINPIQKLNCIKSYTYTYLLTQL